MAQKKRPIVRACRRSRSGRGLRLPIRRTVVLPWLAPSRSGRTGALEQDLTSPEHDGLAAIMLLVGPLAPIELAVDHDARSLAQAVGAQVCLRAVDLDGEVVGLLDPLIAAAPAGAAGDEEPRHIGARRERAQLDVAGQVAGQAAVAMSRIGFSFTDAALG